jgi:hypothetical protein
MVELLKEISPDPETGGGTAEPTVAGIGQPAVMQTAAPSIRNGVTADRRDLDYSIVAPQHAKRFQLGRD